MTSCNGCRLFGAYRTAISIKDSAILIHSTVGCNWGTMFFHLNAKPNDVRQASSVIYEQDIVFGGEKLLNKALSNMLETYKANIFFVLTGCVTEIMNDDVSKIVEEFNQEKKILCMDSAGFKSGSASGVIDTFKALMSCMSNMEAKKNTINIIGIFVDDFFAEDDIRDIKQMLGDTIKINAFIPFDYYENIINAPSASLNIVFEGFEKIGKMFQERFGTPYIIVNYPYGIEGSKKFMQSIFENINYDKSDYFFEQEKGVLEKLYNIKPFIEQLENLPVAIIGDRARAKALRTFLRDELGMRIELYCENPDETQRNYFHQSVLDGECVMLFGSSFEKNLAQDASITLIRFFYPVFDIVRITEGGFCGYKGVLNLIEAIINAV